MQPARARWIVNEQQPWERRQGQRCCSAFCISVYSCFKYIYFVFAPRATSSRERVISMRGTWRVCAAGMLLLSEAGGTLERADGSGLCWKGLNQRQAL